MNTSTPASSPVAPSPPEKSAAADLQALLGTEEAHRWWRRPALWIGVIALVAVAAGLYYWQAQKASNAAPVYVTEAAGVMAKLSVRPMPALASASSSLNSPALAVWSGQAG